MNLSYNEPYKVIFTIALLLSFWMHSFGQRKASIKKDKPNIVLIFTDDQTYSSIHALGNSEIRTPNMDRLVKKGVSFSNAYNMGAWGGAVCVSSRAMIISGRPIWEAKKMKQSWSKSEQLNATWPKLMEQQGYTTYMTGKFHVEGLNPKKVFQNVEHLTGGMLHDKRPEAYDRPQNEQDTAWRPYDSSENAGFWKDGQHDSERLRDQALAYIETATKKDDPFFMYIAFNAPHDPRQAPKKFWDMYPLDQLTLPKSWLPEYPYNSDMGSPRSLRDERLAPFPRTPFIIKTHMREYYASITHLDEQIGKILDALEKSGKIDNTYIFFTSDHGLAIGRHGLVGKQSLFEHSTKPPLVVVGPDIPSNKIVNAPVYLQDIMASSLELAEIKKPEYVGFQSLLNLAKGKTSVSSYPGIYGAYMDLQRSIRKGDYKLILYPKIKKILLFNLKDDPEEMNNLADNPAEKERVASLFKDFTVLQHSMSDPLDLKEWYEAIAEDH